MRKMKLFSLFVLLALLLSATSDAVLADEPTPPTPGVAPKNGYPEEPLTGPVIVEPKASVRAKEGNAGLKQVVCLDYVDDVYHSYDGYYDRGEQASAYNGKPSSDQLRFQIARTVSNGWSASIGISKSVVDAKFGFNHSWSTTKSWMYVATVNPYKTVHIGYKDWYHVKKFNCHRDCSAGGVPWTDYGTGWSSQWFKPHFYTWET